MPFCPHCGSEVPVAERFCPACKRPLGGTPGPRQFAPQRSSSKPIWVVVIAVGCLGLVAVSGIIAALVIPNFLDALNKARVKVTLADMRHITSALVEHANATGSFPDAADFAAAAAVLESSPGWPTDANGKPTALPRVDGWKRAFRYRCLEQCTSYALWSAGRDGVFEHDDPLDYTAQTTPRVDYDRDIVQRDLEFVQQPALR